VILINIVARLVARNFLNPEDGLSKLFSEWPLYSKLPDVFFSDIHSLLYEQVRIVWVPKYVFKTQQEQSNHEKDKVIGLEPVFKVFYQSRKHNARKMNNSKKHFGVTPSEDNAYAAQLQQLMGTTAEGSYSVHSYQNLSLAYHACP